MEGVAKERFQRSSEIITHGGNSEGRPCKFPFIYGNTLHYECISMSPTQYWCATTENFDIDSQFGLCPIPTMPTDAPNITDINKCDSNPCINGGTCTNGVNKFHCNCAKGYNGDSCQVFLGCETHKCQNEAFCVENIKAAIGYSCQCIEQWTGEFCESKVFSACEAHKCQNGAFCIVNKEVPEGFRCQCSERWTGAYCESKVVDLTQVSGMLTFSNWTARSTVLTWVPPAKSVEQHSAVNISYKESTHSVWKEHSTGNKYTGKGRMQFFINRLQPSTQYDFQVKPYNLPPIHKSGTTRYLPSPPVTLEFTEQKGRGLEVSWDHIRGDFDSVILSQCPAAGGCKEYQIVPPHADFVDVPFSSHLHCVYVIRLYQSDIVISQSEPIVYPSPAYGAGMVDTQIGRLKGKFDYDKYMIPIVACSCVFIVIIIIISLFVCCYKRNDREQPHEKLVEEK